MLTELSVHLLYTYAHWVYLLYICPHSLSSRYKKCVHGPTALALPGTDGDAESWPTDLLNRVCACAGDVGVNVEAALSPL
jgi:hypothetical protein